MGKSLSALSSIFLLSLLAVLGCSMQPGSSDGEARSAQQQIAQDEVLLYPPPPVPPELEAQVARTSILWLKSEQANEEPAATDRALRAAAFKFAEEGGFEVVSVYPALGAVALSGEPAEIEARAKTGPWLPVFEVGADFVVSGYQGPGCSAPAPMPQPAQVPLGVRRVGGPLPASGGMSAWVIDSGIDAETAAGHLKVDFARAASCLDDSLNPSGGGCAVGAAADVSDALGHGTMIAGIIGAMPHQGAGLSGVVPGATVVPVKVFGETAYADFARGPLRALDHIAAHARPGDVVNISWGGNWRRDLVTFLTTYHRVNTAIRRLADNGVRFAIAAGNTNEWVQFIAPAGAGSYRAPGGGAVMTVSAVESRRHAWFWRDTFWPASNYGSVTPDFAEPGVNVTSLWPGVQVNTCSGTSFAAPHMAGILLKGLPRADGRAEGDPDGHNRPDNRDPIGRCCAP